MAAALLLIHSLAFACGSMAEMQAIRAKTAPEHRWYDAVAAERFIGAPGEFAHCLTSDEPAAAVASFDLYFHVVPGGGLSAVMFSPETELGRCIKQHVQFRAFPPPPADRDYVGHIAFKVDDGRLVATPVSKTLELLIGVSP